MKSKFDPELKWTHISDHFSIYSSVLIRNRYQTVNHQTQCFKRVQKQSLIQESQGWEGRQNSKRKRNHTINGWRPFVLSSLLLMWRFECIDETMHMHIVYRCRHSVWNCRFFVSRTMHTNIGVWAYTKCKLFLFSFALFFFFFYYFFSFQLLCLVQLNSVWSIVARYFIESLFLLLYFIFSWFWFIRSLLFVFVVAVLWCTYWFVKHLIFSFEMAYDSVYSLPDVCKRVTAIIIQNILLRLLLLFYTEISWTIHFIRWKFRLYLWAHSQNTFKRRWTKVKI